MIVLGSENLIEGEEGGSRNWCASRLGVPPSSCSCCLRTLGSGAGDDDQHGNLHLNSMFLCFYELDLSVSKGNLLHRVHHT